MADQPTKAMTLREAVEITRTERDTYADRAWLDSCMRPSEADLAREDRLDANGIYTAAYARWDRARAIVDAAVLFVESQAEVDAAQNAEPFDGQRMSIAWNNSCDTWRKLRALERGEGTP